MKHHTPRAFLMLFAAMASAGTGAAEAGSVLLSRESTISAVGSTGADDFDLRDGSVDFAGFADSVDTADSGVEGPRVAANQNSRPAMQDDGGFLGAYAEGSASAAGEHADFCEAASAFDLTFQVLGAPSLVNVGGSVGVVGNGSATLSLYNETTGEVLLVRELIAGDAPAQPIEHSEVLDPGVYELLVTANVNAAPDVSMAYYTLSLSVNEAATPGGVTPIPLPPAAWSALGTLAAAGALRAVRRLLQGAAAR